MHPPAVAASRLLVGAGVGAGLAVGLSLQRQAAPSTPALVLGALGAACLAAGWALNRGVGPLATRFSKESDLEMESRVKAEVKAWESAEDVNAKWAALEAKVLTDELSGDVVNGDASVD